MIDSKICPFCKSENLCEAHIVDNSCWCNNINVPKSLRELLPNEFKMKACICKNCIISFKEDNEKFIKKYKITK